MGKRVPIRTKVKLRQAANDHMAMLAQNPERVMSYFQDRRVRCAAQDFTGPEQYLEYLEWCPWWCPVLLCSLLRVR